MEFGEDEHRPQAVGQLVGHFRVEIIDRPEALASHPELHQVPDINHEALHHVLPRPRAPGLRLGGRGKAGVDFHGALGESVEVHGVSV